MSAFVCGGPELPSEVGSALLALTECCAGAVDEGPAGCTCWGPVYDLDQADPQLELPVGQRTEMCATCAYRPDSPERNGDDQYMGSEQGELDDIATTSVFWCHDGMRKPSAWRHATAGITVPVPVAGSFYRPPVIRRETEDGPIAVPYKADGTPGDRCAGWAARRRQLLGAT